MRAAASPVPVRESHPLTALPESTGPWRVTAGALRTVVAAPSPASARARFATRLQGRAGGCHAEPGRPSASRLLALQLPISLSAMIPRKAMHRPAVMPVPMSL